ncbi:uncharacterized protein [Amphiura filiformis]|uniref:uncharacterized protein n=1 Tax=Amphiura filiformis TaxID=82378 RepID=UPI003B21F109
MKLLYLIGIMRNAMSSINMLLLFVLFSVFMQISLCQENKTCDPATESCDITTTPKTTTISTTKTTTPKTITTKTTTTKATTTAKVQSGNNVEIKETVGEQVESPYAGGYDKFTAFAECCWELRLMYFWECDLWLRKCCMDSNITDYRPVCSSTGPGYIRWWKPYRRIFYNECAATKYLCDSLPPLTLPWKCMWRRNLDHPHCRGSNNDVIHETKPPVIDCSRYGLDSKEPLNEKIPAKTNYFRHEYDENMPDWRMPYPEITLDRCGKYERPKEPEPLLPYPPTTAPPLPTPPKFEFQELKSKVRSESLKNQDTTAAPSSPATVSFASSAVHPPPVMDLRTPWYGISFWSVLLGVLTIVFIAGCFVFSLWIGSKTEPVQSQT